VAPSYPVAKQIIWPDLRRALEPVAVRLSESEHSIMLPNGGSVTVKSADNPNSLRGAGLDGVVVDEAAFCEKRVWFEVIRPMLSDRMGWAMFLTSPNGCNWLFDLYQAAGGDGWERWQRPTSDNPVIAREEIQAALTEVGPRAFAQEYEARFTEQEGAMFPAEYFEGDIWFDDWPERSDIRVMALDPSQGRDIKRGDFSAFTMLQKVGRTIYVDADLARRPVTEIVAAGMRLFDDFQPDELAIECNGFQELVGVEFVREFSRRGLAVERIWQFENTEKKENRLSSTIDPLLANRHLRFRRTAGARMLVQQLREFPIGRHDDGPDSLEMAIRFAGQRLAECF
jgi:predicted phage terminase large subunit-like protein